MQKLLPFSKVLGWHVESFSNLYSKEGRLGPQLFQLLATSSNNWMLIKIVKLVRSKVFVYYNKGQLILFSKLTPLTPPEPKLMKKLLPPLTTKH